AGCDLTGFACLLFAKPRGRCPRTPEVFGQRRRGGGEFDPGRKRSLLPEYFAFQAGRLTLHRRLPSCYPMSLHEMHISRLILFPGSLLTRPLPRAVSACVLI